MAVIAPVSSTVRVAIIAGASGLVGRAILQGLLADDSIAKIHALVRRELPLRHTKLAQYRVDFNQLPALPRISEAYIALGTTIRVAGSQQAFRAVDFDAVLAAAKAARSAGAARLGVVSAMGANPRSKVFYNRVKGEMEEALSALGFDTLVIARPSFLAGDRESLGQPVRGGEKLALNLSRLLAPLIPDNYKSIDAAAVAGALLQAVPHLSGRHVLLSGAMRTRVPAAKDAKTREGRGKVL